MNEKLIWDFIYGKCKNAYGTAALMGNLMAESSLNPANVTGSKDPDYIKKADAGVIDFVHDGKAFGLVQWCFRTRKEGLLNYAKSKGTSVGDIRTQLEYMWTELQSYKMAYNAVVNSTNIRESSDVIMLRYEKPSDTSETMKKRRANYGQKFYDMFADGKPDVKPTGKTVVITVDRVNIRAGNGKNFSRITQVNKGTTYNWVATSENGWHAIDIGDRVAWVSGEFSKVG